MIDDQQPGAPAQPRQHGVGDGRAAGGWQRDRSDPHHCPGGVGSLAQLGQHGRVAMIGNHDLVAWREPGLGDHGLHAGRRVVDEDQAVFVRAEERRHLGPHLIQQLRKLVDEEASGVAL